MHSALEAMPQDYPTRYERITAMRHDIQRAFASALTEPLNQHVSSLPQTTLEEKREIASSINRDLRLLNLAARCPETGRAAILLAESGYLDRSSKFRFKSIDEAGHRWRRGISERAPRLELMEAPPREEALARGKRGGDGPARR
jgi:hypothetical protein